VSTYSIRDAARILKVSPARLRYWERTELVQTQNAEGDASQFGFRDLVCVRGILALLDQGVPLRRIRRNVELLRNRLPELGDPTGSLRLWVEGSERIVVRHDDKLFEPGGQMVLDFGTEFSASEPVTDLVSPMVVSSELLDRAEECFERGCQLDGDPATYAEAIEAYRAGIELHDEFADCHCNLGAVRYNRGERDAAREGFERCLEIDSQHVEANFNLANLLEEDGYDQVALHHYKVALEADPLYPDLHINLALLYEKLGVNERAADHWHRYLRLDGGGAWADVARQRLQNMS
jgi:DNA-binding transcriptional MerR regulator